MTVRLTRRSVLGGLGAGLAETLLVKRLNAAALFAQAAKPGKLDLKLTSVTPHVLQIGIAPADATPPTRELGTIDHPHETALGNGSSGPLVNWGKYRIRVEEQPLRITVMDGAQKVRQEIQFEPDSTTVRFRLGSQPLFGMGEGLTGLDRRGTRDGMRNGEGSRGLRTAGARLPIPWLISPEGWGIFVGQPFGSFDLSKDMGVVRSSFATSTRNVYLIVGDTPAELLRGYADLTGYPHLPP